MSEQNALANRPRSDLKSYMRSDEIMTRFEEILGNHQARAFVSSVLLAVANSTSLQECSSQSIATSAIRAATLKLSCDPSTGQAYLVPFKGKATLIVGYKGLYHMALRTNKYRYINVAKIYEGETVVQDRMTGMHKITGSPAAPDCPISGYILYFELVNGYQKSFYMTVKEIHAHAAHYSKSYNKPDGLWKVSPAEMEQKTVLRLGLTHWGVFDPHDSMALNLNDESEGASDLPDTGDVTPPAERVRQSESQNMVDLGFEPDKKAPPAIRPDPTEQMPHDPSELEEGEPEQPQLPSIRYNPEQLILRILEISRTQTGPANGKKGVVIGMLDTILSQTTNPTESRHQLLKFLTGKASTKDIPDNMILALYKWLSPKQDSGGEWQPDAMSVREALVAFNAAQPKQEGLL